MATLTIFLVSNNFVHHVVGIYPVYDIPWKPHIGLGLVIQANPRSIQGRVICAPKPLPLAEFKLHWSEMEPQQQSDLVIKAQDMAHKRLQAQKLKTGAAILGQPQPQLLDDTKIS